MSITNQGPAAMPVLVVTPDELVHHVRELLNQPAAEGRAYTQDFSTKKTDIAYPQTGATTTSHQILGGDVSAVTGWAIRETTGAAVATVRIRDGSSTAGEVIAPIGLAANGFAFMPPLGHGIEVATGRLFLEVVAGSVEGVIYWR